MPSVLNVVCWRIWAGILNAAEFGDEEIMAQWHAIGLNGLCGEWRQNVWS